MFLAFNVLNNINMIKPDRKNALKIVLASTLLPAIFLVSLFTVACGKIQDKNELLNFKNATASIVLSEDGELIGKFFSENRTNVSYEQIPPYLINALIATEDARFYKHNGVDSRSLFRVLFKTILSNNRRSGGGSTITQQLAKNMYGRKYAGPLAVPVTKTKEAVLAHRLEKTFSKEEILTLYLNTVPFGENVFGVETAAGKYFSKKAEFLTIEESAVLIGMLKANTYYNPRLHPDNALTRRNVVLRQMEKYKYLKSTDTDSLCRLPLILNLADYEDERPADYFLVRVKNEAEEILQNVNTTAGTKWNIEKDGLIITTTINLSLQKYAVESFHNHLSVMQKKLLEQYQGSSERSIVRHIAEKEYNRLNLSGPAKEVTDSLMQSLLILQAGMLAIDPVSGAIKAWIGGIDFQTQPYDQIYARRQLASIFKPILYATALEEGMEPCQYLDNDSIILSEFDDWSPENYDHSYGGKYSLAGALAHSMNVPTFSLFLNTDFEKLDSLWNKMGFSFPLNNTPSLALGTAEASIMEVAIAYSVFANGGFKISPQCIASIKTSDGEAIYQNEFNETKERILSERSSLLISAILQKAVAEGTGASMKSVFGVDLPLAGKTGTSQNYADAWFAAFNPKLVLVSRAGASSQAIHFNNGANGSGSTLALPLVALTLKKVQSNSLLKEQLIVPFPELSPELQDALDCPDFRKENILDRFLNLFQQDKTFIDNKVNKAKPKKRLFFKSLFTQ